MKLPKKTGLVLGSGAARGWSHIGIIQALEEAGIKVECVVGASMGALVGGVYAADRLDVLRQAASQLDWKQALHYFLEINFPRSGLVDGGKVVDFLRQNVKLTSIEELPLPFRAVATDINTGSEVVIGKGSIFEAIRASIAIPGIFTPVAKDGQILVDGGLVNPLPVNVARELGATFVIAVDVNYGAVGKGIGAISTGLAKRKKKEARRRKGKVLGEPGVLDRINDKIRESDASLLAPVRRWLAQEDLPSIFDVLGNSLLIMEEQISEARLKVDVPDLLIRPCLDIGYMDFHLAREAIEAGYEAARHALAQFV